MPQPLLGQIVKQEREKKGILPDALASKVGISPQDMAAIESGEKQVDETMIARLAMALGWPAEELKRKAGYQDGGAGCGMPSQMKPASPFPLPFPAGRMPAGAPRTPTPSGYQAPFLYNRTPKGDRPAYGFPMPRQSYSDDSSIAPAIRLCSHCADCPAKGLKLDAGGEVPEAVYSCKFAQAEGCPVFLFEDLRMTFNSYGELKGVEIFSVGTWKGRAFSTSDLDEISRNYESLKASLKPPMVLGHDEEQAILKSSGLPAAGWATRVYREGDKLKADFESVPESIINAVRARKYRTVSVELYNSFSYENRKYGLTLRRIALLGAEIPEVKNLRDIEAMSEKNPWTSFASSDADFIFYTEKDKEDAMSDENKVTLTAEELQKKVDAAVASALTAGRAEMEKQFAEQLKARDTKIEGLSIALASTEAEKRRERFSSFVDKHIEAGRVPPRWKEKGIVSFMERLEDGKDKIVQFGEKPENKKTEADFFMDLLSDMPTLSQFSAEALKGDGTGGHGLPGSTDESRQLMKLAENLMKTPEIMALPERERYNESVRRAAKENPGLLRLRRS